MEKSKKRERLLDLSTMVFGKIPPQARELESAVLGAIMLDKSAMDAVCEFLATEDFYVDAHQRVFKAFKSLKAKNDPIDFLTAVNELKINEELDMVGGPYFVTKLSDGVVSSAHIVKHCKIIKQASIKRELIRIAGEVISEAYEDSIDAFDLQDSAEEKLSLLRSNGTQETIKHYSHYSDLSLKHLEEMRHRETGITGVPSGFAELDKITCGWQPTDFIILAASPAAGKSAFAKILARNAAMYFLQQKTGESVLMFSLEMSGIQIVNRILSTESDVWMHRFKSARLDDENMESLYVADNRLKRMPLYIDETPGLSIEQFMSRCRLAKRKYKVGFIILDYLQLATASDEKNREREIAKIGEKCKHIAKELGVPVLALSQLNREGEKTGEPQLYHLRESGALGQHADGTYFLWGPTEDEKKMNPALENIRYFKIGKDRNGSLEYFGCTFNGANQSFTNFVLTNRDFTPKDELAPFGGSFKPVPRDYSAPLREGEEF